MTITPQLIKDQEFEIKFRGFDPVEVKDYLENIAESFFELQEKCKEQEDELQILHDEKNSSERYSTSLESDMEFTRKVSEELKEGCAQKEEQVRELSAEIEELKLRIADMEQEAAEHEEEVSELEAAREEVEEKLEEFKAEKQSLKSRIEILQEQNKELRKDELSFKSTLATAQQFAEDLKEKSRQEAADIIAAAKEEITVIRSNAQEELERLPREIEILQNKKSKVKEELKSVLEGYLETIDVFYPDGEEDSSIGKETAGGPDYDLFHKIDLNDDGTKVEDLKHKEMDEKALDSLLRGEGGKTDGGDDFDLHNMFNLDDDK